MAIASRSVQVFLEMCADLNPYDRAPKRLRILIPCYFVLKKGFQL